MAMVKYTNKLCADRAVSGLLVEACPGKCQKKERTDCVPGRGLAEGNEEERAGEDEHNRADEKSAEADEDCLPRG